jgi:hypothetical protein
MECVRRGETLKDRSQERTGHGVGPFVLDLLNENRHEIKEVLLVGQKLLTSSALYHL